MSLDRRDILKLGAGAASLAEGPRALAKALAVAPDAQVPEALPMWSMWSS